MVDNTVAKLLHPQLADERMDLELVQKVFYFADFDPRRRRIQQLRLLLQVLPPLQ